MLREIRLLTRLENLNLYGLNRLKYTTDKKEKRRICLLACVWFFAIVVFLGYSGGCAYGLHLMGLTHAVPALFTSIVSLVLLFTGAFSSSSALFRKNGFDFLSALPIHPFSIVVSRLIRMYVENLLACFAVTLPAIGVYAYFSSPAFLFYPAWLVSVLFMPMIPMCLSVLLGALITLLSSAFRKTAVIQALITVVFVAGILFGSSYLTKIENELTPEAIRSVTELVLKSLEKTYLPAAWIGGIAVQKYLPLLPLIGSSLALVALTVIFTVRIFPFVLKHSVAKSERKAFSAEKSIKSSSVMPTLVAREFKRYFASGIYLLNTIISPVMAVGAGVMFMAGGAEAVVTILPFDINFPLICAFLIGIICSLMPPSAVSLSMEGKTWWLLKALPVRTEHLMGAKILMSVLLHAPFLIVSSVLTVIALSPNAGYAVVMILTPFVLDVFSCTWALFINTKFPRFDWENEVYVVKQSAAAGVGGLTAPLIAILGAIPVAVIGTVLSAVVSLGAFILITFILVHVIFKTELIKL